MAGRTRFRSSARGAARTGSAVDLGTGMGGGSPLTCLDSPLATPCGLRRTRRRTIDPLSSPSSPRLADDEHPSPLSLPEPIVTTEIHPIDERNARQLGPWRNRELRYEMPQRGRHAAVVPGPFAWKSSLDRCRLQIVARTSKSG